MTCGSTGNLTENLIESCMINIMQKRKRRKDGLCPNCGGVPKKRATMCSKCAAEYARERRKTHPPKPLTGEARRKMIARSYANVYLRREKIERQPCVVHHHDYFKPLDITWLCAECHRDEHEVMASL